MIIDYETFINNINNFDSLEYLKNKDLEFVNQINNFNIVYKIIEDEEKKKFNQNNIKFKKFYNDKNNKFSKISRDIEKPEPLKKILIYDTVNNENEKLSILINSYLNKISEDTFDKISDDMIKELINLKNIKIFEILSEQITNKCILDFKYRNLYIQLCNKIWNNNDIHFNLVNINKDDKNYTWNILNDSEIYGPYENENYMKNIIIKNINFKKYFLNYLSQLFKDKDTNIQNLDDDDFFIRKKKLMSLIELISILYNEKYINFDLINLIIIDLLHLDNNFKIIEEIEFELINLILKNLNDSKNILNVNVYKNVINEFIGTLNNILEIEEYSNKKRSNFFINDNIKLFNLLINYKENKFIEKNSKNNYVKVLKVETFETFNESLLKKNILNSMKIFNKLDNENKIKTINNLMDSILEERKNISIEINTKLLKIIKEKDLNYIKKYVDNIIDNIDDIYLDIPNIINNLKNLLEGLNIYNNYTKILEEKNELLNNYSSDNESDSEEFCVS